jgi:hypothetical protein
MSKLTKEEYAKWYDLLGVMNKLALQNGFTENHNDFVILNTKVRGILQQELQQPPLDKDVEEAFENLRNDSEFWAQCVHDKLDKIEKLFKQSLQSKDNKIKELEEETLTLQKSIAVGTYLETSDRQKINNVSMMLDNLLFDCPEDLDVIYNSIKKAKEVLDNE